MAVKLLRKQSRVTPLGVRIPLLPVVDWPGIMNDSIVKVCASSSVGPEAQGVVRVSPLYLGL